MSASEATCIAYVQPAQYCGECFNAVLADATGNPAQDFVSVFCPHGGGCLITARLCDHGDDGRVVYCWSISGPMTEAQAAAAIRQAASAAGLQAVDNSRVTH